MKIDIVQFNKNATFAGVYTDGKHSSTRFFHGDDSKGQFFGYIQGINDGIIEYLMGGKLISPEEYELIRKDLPKISRYVLTEKSQELFKKNGGISIPKNFPFEDYEYIQVSIYLELDILNEKYKLDHVDNEPKFIVPVE